jgi:diguanylate cyclase
MVHLLAQLLLKRDLSHLALLAMQALLGGGAFWLINTRQPVRLRMRLLKVSALSVIVTAASCGCFHTAFLASYPRLDFIVPPQFMIPAMGLSLLGSAVAASIQEWGRRSARNAVLSGSLMACAASCMVFIGMAGLIQPFDLAFDLGAVLSVAALSAALAAFALWEMADPDRKLRGLGGMGLLALALALVSLGSLCAILPFNAWINTVSTPDNLASSPLALIIAAEAVTALAFTFTGSLLDNRASRREQREADRVRQLADSTFEAILIHRDGIVLDGNQRLTDMIARSPEEIRGMSVAECIRLSSPGSLLDMAEGQIRPVVPVETEIIAPDGSSLPVETLSRDILYGNRPAQVLAIRDIRDRKAAEDRIRFLAHHDILTSLPNRVMLHDKLEAALQRARKDQSAVSVLCLDLDGFKKVNDTLGHLAGDQLLRLVADRLRGCVREFDLVARVGGDEFVVVAPAGAQPDLTGQLARRILDALCTPFNLDGQIANIGSSIGIASFPADGEIGAELLKHADIALYRAKEDGRGRFHLFEPGMDRRVRERHSLERDLRQAIEDEAFALHFQPIFNQHGRLVSCEALLRWFDPQRGLVSPAQFIPIAEQTGLIVPLGRWVMQEACRVAAGWANPVKIGINLSPVQVKRENVLDLVGPLLEQTGLAPERLELEITEGVLIEDFDRALDLVKALRAMGVRIVLDDFGTGHSSLSYLHRFPFDKLKIDRSFVQRLGQDSSSEAITNSIIMMAHALGLGVTAEGVETSEQFKHLSQNNCQEFQGYFLARPMTEAQTFQFNLEMKGRSVFTLSGAYALGCPAA